ncbi:MAG: xanthine dehydrogenase family protein subunit M [Deltaproteobacteria bacterium]|nr:xanthine dehydrogenase family protein subunit M [Deltaproteobacteria bacterium]MBI3294998.1 xanthine dehydrogenase family protein subunit M [Deltaproteobacteria bacterium]
MRGTASDYSLVTPKSLCEALTLIQQGAHPLAGGTDLMVLFEAGSLQWKSLVNIAGLKELKGIRFQQDRVELGALTTYTQILEDKKVVSHFPMLAESARLTGAWAIQNRGTLGGNIANASPAADSPPSLLAYDAEITLTSATGDRTIPYVDFHQGYKKTAIREGEIIRSITLPFPRRHSHTYFRKVGTRNAQAISKVVVAGLAHIIGGRLDQFRWAVGSLAPFPKRCRHVEKILWGNRVAKDLIQTACDNLKNDIAPIDDIRSTSTYRMIVARNCLKDFLEQLL